MRPPLDPEGLQRFVEAQELVYDAVCRELRAGRKTSHWMWFVFPQLRVLGRSATARFFGLADLAEAQAYAAHPVLGPRLVECSELVLAASGRSAHEIFGTPDDLKLRSCMTLFELATAAPVFARVLDRLYAGERDPLTLAALGDGGGP
ncbi:DUF1810 domain-containing protein [Variovorax ginsengisoli]|uniref:DUF1810 domain-containing protein n=1 Tax=Variovorax ginsengisoli TaxID=363844 RepID=A0ABT8S791_9BURK|nr:DUF1810 domain-containing protein [Variovorax ginsengisoli]MDN8615163.1 DUF1810 domain-containing protein [Variovorax ginsengisoli]MDO1534333.1 DUF1810 domain-containing protein [Variovorax ginsengisoli]